jgi:hypothetical protein
MTRIARGPGNAHITTVLADAVAGCAMTGLVLPANGGELSAQLLRAVVDCGAKGVLSDLTGAVLAFPPISPAHYGYVPPELRLVPVAMVVTPEQWPLYQNVQQAGAAAGVIRRAFLSPEAAQAWVTQEAEVWVQAAVYLQRHPALGARPGTPSGKPANPACRSGRAVRRPCGPAG